MIWLLLISIGLLTFGLRLSFIALAGRGALPAGLRRVLRFVPVSVLSAIILPELVMPGGHLLLTGTNARLWAGLVAILVAWRTKNVVLTIVCGMLTLWLLQYLLP